MRRDAHAWSVLWLLLQIRPHRAGCFVPLRQPRSHRPLLASLLALLCWSGLSTAHAFTLDVRGSDGAAVTGYRWLLQEDTSRESVPGDPAVPGKHLSLSFHTSYAPVVAKGDETDAEGIDQYLQEGKRYFISVLPDSAGTDGGYSNGGGPVVTPVTTVTVNKLPFPTAQISVQVFQDNNPINNAPDLPAERGLAGFTVQLFEAGGSYGANGGRLMYDAFGNPLGTTYNADGSIKKKGTGVITTNANGVARIKNLVQGKYTIFVVPPSGTNWVQTATIEGTAGIDAWVKANEPAYFQEFGPPGHHVFVGFTKPINDTRVLTGGSTITGRVVNQHMSRSPDYAFFNGEPVPRCWVGLNDAAGKGVWARRCNADSSFAIPNVPEGRYQLVIWDEPLDVIFASHFVDVPAGGGEVDLMDVPVFRWFGRVKGSVFYDVDADGFPDPGESGIKDQAVNLRFRDGSIYQMAATAADGGYEFEEVFPFFNWLVAEVDFARFKATGVTVTVDGGGAIDPDDPWTFGGVLNPQPQAENEDLPYRTETGPVLVEGVQTFLGQTNVMQWGKKLYNSAAGENGGISGMVRYATTRAEDDPAYAAAENWEPGIPGVTVRLYRDSNNDRVADGPAINEVTTDSWDASSPTGCQGEVFIHKGMPTDCYDGMRNFNQVRPAVFDGGYAFTTMWQFDSQGEVMRDGEGNPLETPLPPGTYIVEVLAPPGYEHVKEEDKNVDFGDTYVPGTLALPPPCVGANHLVPAELTLLPGVPSAYANQQRPLCDRKQVRLAAGQNAAADFYLFTEVPVAGQIVGMILNDLANEFDPNAPTFGEKFAPPHLPISIRDWTGREINRVYSDEFGNYNALVPSTYTINAPMPSGVSPNMLTACLNSPVKPDGTPDPWFNRQYTQFCYTFQYMPGKTTYLDTPVLPIAAMAGPGDFPLDCEYPDGTPMIHSVVGRSGTRDVGPFVQTPISDTYSGYMRYLTIVSVGRMEVPNPAYDGTNAKTVTRDYGFGDSPGVVRIGNTTLDTACAGCRWSDGVIVARVPAAATTGQLTVTRGNGLATIHSVTVTVGNVNGRAPRLVRAGESIQAAIDAAAAGDLITVAPGTYDELIIMHKPVKLQGWGPGSVIINGVKAPAEKLQAWRDTLYSAYSKGWFHLLPGQAAPAPGAETVMFGTDEGAAVTVVANQGEFTALRAPRIDGFTITGADHGGGIYVNGYAANLAIANNRIVSNQGFYGGGIHVGNPYLISAGSYVDSANDYLRIYNNQITQNGSLDGAGGGISLYTGTDFYQVSNNFVCGNFAMGGGGGIAHLGVSNRGSILRNTVLFNESFNQGQNVNGGGILVAGLPSLTLGGLSAGVGNFATLSGNLIQGNLAGAGDGGGLRVEFANRASLEVSNNMIVNNVAGMAGGGISLQDVATARIVHNTVANNDSTATAGGAFAPGSPNRSTAQPAGIVTYGHSAALRANLGCGTTVTDWRCFSDPALVNNIVWNNRSFYWEMDEAAAPNPAAPPFGLREAGVDDLAVLGETAYLHPYNSILTQLAEQDGHGYHGSNSARDPMFLADYVNTAPGQTIQQPELTTAIATAPALDEGGNFIDVNFGPLTLTNPATGEWYGNYHIQSGSPAAGIGMDAGLTTDFDNQARPRPAANAPDAGADEIE